MTALSRKRPPNPCAALLWCGHRLLYLVHVDRLGGLLLVDSIVGFLVVDLAFANGLSHLLGIDGLRRFQRETGGVEVPGCRGGAEDNSKTDYCTLDLNSSASPSLSTFSPTPSPTNDDPEPTNEPTLTPRGIYNFGGNPPPDAFPLGLCEGDCDVNADVSISSSCVLHVLYLLSTSVLLTIGCFHEYGSVR